MSSSFKKFTLFPVRGEKGQAMAEAVVVLPILILLLWGVWHLHMVSFYSARAEMAARHAAWIKSVKEVSSASVEGLKVLFDQDIPEGIKLAPSGSATGGGYVRGTIEINPKAGLIISLKDDEEETDTDGVMGAISGAFSTILGWIKSLMDAIPLTQPLVNNAEATVTYSVSTPGMDFFQKKTKAYFANRYRHLYFHNIWDLFKTSSSEDFPPMGEAGGSKEDMEGMVDNFEEELEKNKDSLSEEEYQHYKEEIEKWREMIRSMP